jgi:Fe-S cluster assembly protein SufD
MTQNLTRAGETFGAGLGRDAVEQLSDRKQEPAWLRERRLQAWNIYEQMPTPTPLERPWKYTDITRLDFDQFVPYAAGKTPDAEACLRGYIEDRETRGGLVVQQDSETSHAAIDPELAQRGVIVCGLDEAVQKYPDLVRESFMTTCVPAATSKLTALHAAFWSGGVFVYVPSDVEIALPLHSAVWAQAEGLAIFPHALIVAERNSRVTLVDEYASPNRQGMALSDGVAEIFVKDGAQVRYVNLQRWDTGTYHFSTQRALLGRDAVLRYVTIGLGGRISKLTNEAILEGAGSNSEMLGLFFGEKGQKFDAVTLQDHRGAHTTSDLLYKSALRDRAQSIYYGLVRVGAEARGSDANQENRNLLLSDQAKADSDPVLEILTSEVVRCAHGATVGPVDEEQLFYLQCRGLPHDEAERLLVAGFFTGVIQRIPVVQVRTKLENAILERLEG